MTSIARRSGFARISWPVIKVLTVAAIPAALLVHSAAAQNPPAPVPGTLESSDKDTRAYDKHDLSGLWSRNPGQFHLAPCPECRDRGPAPGYGFFGDVPPRTPAGEKKFQLNKPGRGYELGSKEANEHPEVDIGMRRAVIPALGNDPEARCEPLGLPRLVAFSGGGASMEMVQAKDQIVQKFEWTWDFREIWLDGRKTPNVEDYLPRYNGYSVGKWEGDTLVVTTVGFDDRQWLDQYGYPISDKAVLVERYKRTSPNRLQVDMTLTDPVMYTRPWHSDTKVWALIPKEAMTVGGWSGLLEDRCVPSDEARFNVFRDHAAGKK